MNVDERVQEAGERLAARPVAVPSFEQLERAARKRRQAVVSVVTVAALGATTVGVWATVGRDAGSISSSGSTIATATTVPAFPATTIAPGTTTVAASSLPVSPVATTPTTITGPAGVKAGTFADIEPDSTVILPPAPIAGRVSPAAVWTGTEMVVWGGNVLLSPSGSSPLSDGAAFNPTTGTWRVIAPAPIQGRSDPATVWTGTEMVVWGGSTGEQTVADGAAYEPATDTWRTLAAAPISDASRPVAAWTGTEMLVVSGERTVGGGSTPIDDAAAYDPANDSWRQIASPPSPSAPPYPQSTWTGDSLLMVTSETSQTLPVADVIRLVDYRPANDTWTVVADDFEYTLVGVSAIGAAVALPYEAGVDGVVLDRLGAAIGRVAGRPETIAPWGFGRGIWTGHEILFWAGNAEGVALDPVTQIWRAFPAGDVANRVNGALVWADGVMLGWGGFSSNRDGTNVAVDDGVMYRPPTPPSVPPPATQPVRSFEVVVPSGLTVEQVGELLATSIDTVDPDEFARAAAESAASSDIGPDGVHSSEGLLAPGSYTITETDSETDIARQMIGEMNDVAHAADIDAESAAIGRSPYETLIIASMIELEATVEDDLSGISRVIHNRLLATATNPDQPLPLQVDSAVAYGQNQLETDPNIPFSELRSIPSDWNTYLLPGLPRTPISNPSAAAIDAALHPRPNPSPDDPLCINLPALDECLLLFYVIGAEDGSMTFATTPEQHAANVDRANELGLL